MLEPDTLSFDQYFNQWRGAGYLQPELRLMLAVLQEAVDCYQENVFLRGRKQEELFKDAEKWFFEDVHEWPFSFVNICEAVGIHPEYFRKGLSSWKQKARAATSAHRKIQIKSAATPTLASLTY